jgi:hypothetical protein
MTSVLRFRQDPSLVLTARRPARAKPPVVRVAPFSSSDRTRRLGAMIALVVASVLGATSVWAQSSPADEADRETLTTAAATPVTSAAPSTASATNTSSLRLSGFGTLGLTSTPRNQGQWRFEREVTHKGTEGGVDGRVDSRLGLQANWQLHRDWEFVTQLLLKARAAESAATDSIQWAFLSYMPTHDVTLRVGRTSPDLFLLADARNVGFAYPWMRPSRDVYGWVPFERLDGADATYRHLSEGVSWNVKGYVGQSRATLASTTDSSFHLTGKDVFGLTLSRDTGDLLLKASYVHTRTKIGLAPAMAVDALSPMLAMPVPAIVADTQLMLDTIQPSGRTQYFALGMQLDVDRWLIQTEGSIARFAKGTSGGKRGYVSLGYRWPRLTTFAKVSRTLPDNKPMTLSTDWFAALSPIVGPQAAGQLAGAAGAVAAMSPGRIDESTRTLGLRWDRFDNVSFKAQVDHIKVKPAGSALWLNGTASSHKAVVWSLGMDFTF